MKALLIFLGTAILTWAESPRAVIVLDASGSMWGQIEGKAKIEIARETIADLLQNLPPELELGLVAYGHRRKGDCDDIEMLIPPGQVDRDQFLIAVQNITPKGKTPLTAAVEFAAEGMNFSESRSSVILITDGLENCDRDPCATAQRLEKEGIDFTAHVIAFDLAAKDALTVECLAKETGGQFLPAGDATSLATALMMAVEDAVEEVKPEEEEPAPEDPVTLTVPETAPAGSKFEVIWEASGKTLPNDFIAIVPAGAEEGTWVNYAYSKNGSPLKLTALINSGSAEVRYLSGKTRKTLGRAPIELTEVAATLQAPKEAIAGSDVKIKWTGPAYSGDFITIVSADSEEKKWAKYAYVKDGTDIVSVACPPEAGACEIRYVQGQGYHTLARIPLKVTEAEATLTAPEKVLAGAEVTIQWTGPMNKGDFITIVPKETAEKKWAKYAYATEQNQPAKVVAPMEPGPAEIRYAIGQGYETLARIDILIEEATVTLSAPESVEVGSEVLVNWSGPANKGDFITVVPKDLAEGKWAKYQYTTEKNQPARITAPSAPGDGEIRYVSGQGYKTLARIPIEITASTSEED